MGNTESSPLKYCSGNQGQLYTERHHYGIKEQMNMGASRVNFTVPTLESKVQKFQKRYQKVEQPSQLRQIRRQTRPSQQPVVQVSPQQMQDDVPQLKTNWEEATRCKIDGSGLCDCQREGFMETARELMREFEREHTRTGCDEGVCKADASGLCECQREGFRKTAKEIVEAEAKTILAASVKPRGVDVDEYLKESGKPSFNVYVSCLDWDCDEYWDSVMKDCQMPKLEPEDDTEACADIEQAIKESMKVYEGLFGHVIVHVNGLVLYTDINGEKHCEDFDAESLRKTFPMGISFGSLSKSIWFEDPVERDNCFDEMTKKLNQDAELCGPQNPPTYEDVMTNPGYYEPQRQQEQMALEECDEHEETDEDNIKVFEGINKRDVIVHADNLVLFTDINGFKHCVNYNPREIKKSFPNGISYGGLPKSIWFADAQERDLCYALMQWNLDQYEEEQQEPDVYEGLYGRVTVHKDGQVEYTSLTGDRIKCFYEPSEIAEVFPMGISYGRLPKTIWFNDAQDASACLTKMRNIDN